MSDTTDADEWFKDYINDAYKYAMRYLELGLSIIPVRFSDKTPAIEWKKYQTEQTPEHIVQGWFEDGVPDGSGGYTKAFGIGIITGAISNLVVCDCDNQEALTYAVTEAGLFSLLTVQTTRGQHIYFRHPGGTVQNKAGGLGRDWPDVGGLDLRGDGGYVLAPPSVKLNAEGKFKHKYSFNCPEEEVENFLLTIPVWPGIKLRVSDEMEGGEWSLEKMDLSSVTGRSYGQGVWEEMGERVKSLGRKLREGDGRNPWLVKYIGECIASGMEESQARVASDQFQLTYYDPKLSPVESETVLRSVVTTDKRNHPEKYKQQEDYDNKNVVRQGRAAAMRFIRPDNLAELKALGNGRQFLIDPFIPAQSIIQVVGFNGHGKSLMMLNMLWAAAKGVSFGSAYVDTPLRSLYLDFEGSHTTFSERTDDCADLIGPMDENLWLWNANAAQDDLCLNEDEAITRLGSLIEDAKPQVVVFDTVRQAWSGLEENSPHGWIKINKMAMYLRNSGMSVIFLHHRNKPSLNGHGRESGSTAQLKDLDLQIFVTKVVQSKEEAAAEAALEDMKTSVMDSTGNVSTAWNYLTRTLPTGYVLRMVFELSFGKKRQATVNHITTYIGLAQDNISGRWVTASSLTPIQKALALSQRAMSVEEISNSINVSIPTVRGWLNKKGEQ